MVKLPTRTMMNNLPHQSLVVTSHNTTGWSEDKADILKTVFATHGVSIGLVQEHFQLSANIYKIQSKFSDYELFSLPAHKGNEHLHRGRPSGGLGILYHKSIQKFVKHLFQIVGESKV